MKHLGYIGSLILFYGCTTTQVSIPEAVEIPAKTWKYPPARKADIVDGYHGTVVADPYRWLEDPDDPETRAWVDEENRLTREFIDAIPARAGIRSRVAELWNYPKYGIPREYGGRYFFTRNDGLQNQAVLYMAESLHGEPVEILDPNQLSEDGTAALTNQTYSRDGTLLAYGVSHSGSDWQDIHIREVDTGRDFGEVLHWCKFTAIAWTPDGSGFFYNRFPTPGTVPAEDQNSYNRVYWHRLGSPQSDDLLVFEMPARKELGFWPSITEDGRYLLLWVYYGTDDRNGIYFREIGSEGDFSHLFDVGTAMFNIIGNVGSRFFIHTNLDAPRGRIISVDISRREPGFQEEILPQQADVISDAALVSDQLVVQFMRNANEILRIYDLDGTFKGPVDLPTLGSVNGLWGRQAGSELFFGFTSFLYPTSIYRYDFTSGNRDLVHSPTLNFDPSTYVTTQIFYPSRDGTQVSMFLTYRKGLQLDGENPVLLYGYGGFNVSRTPGFSISKLIWMEAGGVYALTNLRGGSEYGEEWHQAGMLGNKQNVFDDFIAAAEWLIHNGYTRTGKLAINGGSNGGLLVSACMLQRPDLFGAVLAQVPVTDMLRYHKWTVGRYWVPEYGNAESDPEHFKFLYAYSPLHNVKTGVTYPPTLITTADTDDRVVPAHAKKFAATLQAADPGRNPLLIRIETKAGHGAGKPTSKVIDEVADEYAFLFQVLGIDWE